MNNLYILTTAIIRPNIHKKGISHFIKLINKSTKILNKFNKIYFIINLDDVNSCDKQENIKLLKKYKNPKIFINIYENTNPCFFNAFKNVYFKCNEIQNKLENNIFFWLEDDWYIEENNFNKYLEKEIISFINDDNQYLMTVNQKPSGPPFLFKQFYFEKVIYYINNIHLIDKTSKDPEVIMKRIWKKSNIPNNNKRKQIGIRKHITDEDKKYPILFIDSGKDWATKNNLKKWKKNNVSNDLSYKKIN